MVWTPFGKSTTSTAGDAINDAPITQAPPMDSMTIPAAMQQPPYVTGALPIAQHDIVPQPTPAHQENTNEGTWFNEQHFEGQLAVDVFQTSNDIVIKAPIAGVNPKDIEISVTDDVITIKGHRKVDDNVPPEDFYCQECYYGIFSRSIILPVAVVTEQADATFSNGILTITIPKAANARTKKLEVKAL